VLHKTRVESIETIAASRKTPLDNLYLNPAPRGVTRAPRIAEDKSPTNPLSIGDRVSSPPIYEINARMTP